MNEIEKEVVIITIGSRSYLIEKEPIGNVLIQTPVLVIHGGCIRCLEYSSDCGWVGKQNNRQYTTAKVSELNGTNFYYTSTYELHKVIKTTSKKLNKKFRLNDL